jgi:hypothetical protein
MVPPNSKLVGGVNNLWGGVSPDIFNLIFGVGPLKLLQCLQIGGSGFLQLRLSPLKACRSIHHCEGGGLSSEPLISNFPGNDMVQCDLVTEVFGYWTNGFGNPLPCLFVFANTFDSTPSHVDMLHTTSALVYGRPNVSSRTPLPRCP